MRYRGTNIAAMLMKVSEDERSLKAPGFGFATVEVRRGNTRKAVNVA
jgi:hypothetical protein